MRSAIKANQSSFTLFFVQQHLAASGGKLTSTMATTRRTTRTADQQSTPHKWINTSVHEMKLPPPSEPLSQEAPLKPRMIPREELLLVHTTENNGRKKRGRDDHRENTQPRGPIVARITNIPTKAYGREVLQLVGGPSMTSRIETIISFNDNDLEGIKFSHDDSLVIMWVISNSSVKRVLVDVGASVDILFHEGLIRMGYNDSQLTPSDMHVYGILGRIGMNAFQVVAPTYHLKINFPTKNDIGMEKGDQKEAQRCYEETLRTDEIRGKALPLEDMDVREDEERRGKPDQDLIPIHLDPKDPTKVTYIGASLQGPSKEKLTNFLQENTDVFAWITADTPGIDPQLITHKLNVNSLRKPIKQKKRSFTPERQGAIKQEALNHPLTMITARFIISCLLGEKFLFFCLIGFSQRIHV